MVMRPSSLNCCGKRHWTTFPDSKSRLRVFLEVLTESRDFVGLRPPTSHLLCGISSACGLRHPIFSAGFRRPAASDIPSTPRAIQRQVRPKAAFCALGGTGKQAFRCPRTHKNAAPSGAAPAIGLHSAEKKGFEPLKQVYARLAHFECAAFVHSATSPGAKLQKIPCERNYLFIFSRMRLRRPWERLTTWVLSERSSHSRARSYWRII